MRKFKADFLIQAGFGLDVFIAEEIAGASPIKTLCAVVGVRVGSGAVATVIG